MKGECELEKKMSEFNFIRMSDEDEMYFLQLSKHVFLIIQGKQNKLGDYSYDFYKQTYIQNSSRVYYYAKNLTHKQLITRVSKHFENKKAALIRQMEHKQPWKLRKNMLQELEEQKKKEKKVNEKKWTQLSLDLNMKK